MVKFDFAALKKTLESLVNYFKLHPNKDIYAYQYTLQLNDILNTFNSSVKKFYQFHHLFYTNYSSPTGSHIELDKIFELSNYIDNMVVIIKMLQELPAQFSQVLKIAKEHDSSPRRDVFFHKTLIFLSPLENENLAVNVFKYEQIKFIMFAVNAVTDSTKLLTQLLSRVYSEWLLEFKKSLQGKEQQQSITNSTALHSVLLGENAIAHLSERVQQISFTPAPSISARPEEVNRSNTNSTQPIITEPKEPTSSLRPRS